MFVWRSPKKWYILNQNSSFLEKTQAFSKKTFTSRLRLGLHLFGRFSLLRPPKLRDLSHLRDLSQGLSNFQKFSAFFRNFQNFRFSENYYFQKLQDFHNFSVFLTLSEVFSFTSFSLQLYLGPGILWLRLVIR